MIWPMKFFFLNKARFDKNENIIETMYQIWLLVGI
jgi:hypothetical protein